MNNYITNFTKELKRQNKSQATIKNYTSDLNSFKKWIDENHKTFETLTRFDLQDYIDSIQDVTSDTTKARRVSCLKTFYNFICEENENFRNISGALKRPKVEKKAITVMSTETAKDIIETCLTEIEALESKGDSEVLKSSIRNYAILKLVFGSGLRREELANIKMKDLDLSKSSLLVRGKGNKQRVVSFHDSVKKALQSYLRLSRGKFKTASKSEMLFINQKSAKMSLVSLNRIMNRYMELADCKEQYKSMHTARKRFATESYKQTKDIYAVANALGHESVNTTRIYVQAEQETVNRACQLVNI